MRKISSIEMPPETIVSPPSESDTYAVCSYDTLTCSWNVTIYDLDDRGTRIGSGVNPGSMIAAHNVTKVFLVGLDQIRHEELWRTLAKYDIELVPIKAA